MKPEKELTRAELQIMNVLWDIRKGSVKEVQDCLDEPHPAYNTVLTFLRILVEKGYVGYDVQGKRHLYYPLFSKSEYTRSFMKDVREKLFRGSTKSLISFFVHEDELSAADVQELIDMLKQSK